MSKIAKPAPARLPGKCSPDTSPRVSPSRLPGKDSPLTPPYLSRKNNQVLRLRLDKAQPAPHPLPLASAQDDKNKNARPFHFPTPPPVILSKGEPKSPLSPQDPPEPKSKDLAISSPTPTKAKKTSPHKNPAHHKPTTPQPVILSEGEPTRVLPPQDQPEPKSKDLAIFSPASTKTKKTSPQQNPAHPTLPHHPPNHLSQSAILRVARKMERTQARLPRIDSFLDFLTRHARVKSGSGYVPYHFRGREALLPIVQQLDAILASGETDASLALCGGAQFGKTVLMLNLLAYLVAVRFRNVGYYLPDDDLVAGLVDGKLRPDVLDQIPWLARLLTVGKTLAPSGRAVNRKGAFLCTDGTRSALAFMRGLGKIPTSFSMDVVIQDEKDDLPEEHARFLSGRMTASNLRLSLIIGTQRYHGAGQNLAFTEGTQHIGLLTCPGCGGRHNPETLWPGICRLRKVEGGRKKVEEGAEPAPRLTLEGHFVRSEWTGKHEADEVHEKAGVGEGLGKDSKLSGRIPSFPNSCSSSASCFPVQSDFRSLPIPFTPGQEYFLGCPDCGAELDRARPEWHALAPERAAQRRWSYRLSQLLFPDIDLAQIVAAWQLAIRDPAHMNVFCTDRLALPKSGTQTLTPHDLQAARRDYRLWTGKHEANEGQEEGGGLGNQLDKKAASVPPSSPTPSVSCSSSASCFPVQSAAAYGGLDLGDQCWFVARAVETRAPFRARLLWVEPIAAERVRKRVPELFRELRLTALCVDAGPLRDLARDLAFLLNDLDEDSVPSTDDVARNIFFSHGSATLPLSWHAASERWRGVRCAPVEFTQREAQGLRHKVGWTQDGRIYPLLAAHRDETIQRVITELLPEQAGRLLESADGTASQAEGPRFLLPTPTEESRAVLDLYERHLLAGARQERSADGRTLRYLDKCENHFLLATAYAALAELLAPARAENSAPRVPAFRPLPIRRERFARRVIG